LKNHLYLFPFYTFMGLSLKAFPNCEDRQLYSSINDSYLILEERESEFGALGYTYDYIQSVVDSKTYGNSFVLQLASHTILQDLNPGLPGRSLKE